MSTEQTPTTVANAARPALPFGSASAERVLRDLLQHADIEVGGSRPHDMQVHEPRFYRRVLAAGSLGLGESYVKGWWDVEALDVALYRILQSQLSERAKHSPRVIFAGLGAKLFSLQTRGRSSRNVVGHYELGLDLFERMLDERMIYSCGYWREANDLDAAQEAKLDLICRKLGVGEGTTVLDLGCGWGGFARYAAETYGARVTGVTLSSEQAAVAKARCAGLPVEIRVEDYRDVRGRFDAVVSIGMIEHVGARSYRTYMESTDRVMAPQGVSLVHTISGNRSTQHVDPWIRRSIFPGANLPSLTQISRAVEGLFVIEDVHNFGPDYDRTLMAWHQRFEASWPELRTRYPERFRRMWRFYLLACAAAFRARSTQLYQVLLTRPGTRQPGGTREH